MTDNNLIEFHSTTEPTWVMRITADKRIEVNEGVDVTYAAQKVLDAMQSLLVLQPKREWVGLTPEERKQLWDEWENGHVVEATEAKLKEKNT